MKRLKEDDDYTQPELPHFLTRLLIEVYGDIIDIDEMKDVSKLKVGDSFMAPYKGQVVLYKSEDKEDYASFSHITTRMEMKEPKPQKIPFQGYAIYVIINPPKLHKCPWGWHSECFRPQVKVMEEWRDASAKECEIWQHIKPEGRRVIYCLGVLGNDEDAL